MKVAISSRVDQQDGGANFQREVTEPIKHLLSAQITSLMAENSIIATLS